MPSAWLQPTVPAQVCTEAACLQSPVRNYCPGVTSLRTTPNMHDVMARMFCPGFAAGESLACIRGECTQCPYRTLLAPPLANPLPRSPLGNAVCQLEHADDKSVTVSIMTSRSLPEEGPQSALSTPAYSLVASSWQSS
jgi:hypothetical protein